MIPPDMTLEQRIEMTASARDADAIPKVAGAGGVFVDENGERLQLMHNGLKVVADGYCGPWMTRLIELCHGHHEPQEERAFDAVVSTLPDNASMVEIGGGWSYYSLWFLKDRPGRRALIVEPDPVAVELARRNLALNALRAEVVWGYVGESYAAIASRAPQPPPQLDLPKLIRDSGLGFVDLLHCDAQGAEVEALELSADRLRAGEVGWVFLSTHGAAITGDPLTHQKCLARLRELGACIEAEHDVHESFSGDGLIVARFGAPPLASPFPALSRNRYSRSYYPNPLHEVAALKAAERGVARADVVALVQQACQSLTGESPPPSEIAAMVAALAEGRIEVGAVSERYFPAAQADPPTRTVGRWLELQRPSALGESGERILSPTDKEMLPYLLKHGSWQTEPLDLARACLDPAGEYALVDIGANIGMFARQFLTAFPHLRPCVCVEPDARNFEALTLNLAKFADRDLRLFPVALGERAQTAAFYRDADNIGNYSLNRDAMRNRRFDQAEIVTLDARAWAQEQLADCPRLILKCDTQGSDEAIATRIPLAIWRKVVFAVLEIWRIEKPAFDAQAFAEIVRSFPHWSFRGVRNAPVEEILEYSAGTDWMFYDLYMWR